MDLYADRSATFRIEFPGRGWVDMREEITAGDRKIGSNAGRGNIETTMPKNRRERPDKISADWSDQAYTIALLKEMIVAWSLDDPVTRENVQKLPQWMIDDLMEELDQRNKKRPEAEQENLSPDSPAPYEEPERETEPTGPVS